MGCFNLGFLEQLCIMIVIIIAVWWLIQLLLPSLINVLPALVVGIIRIALWVIMAFVVIKIIFGLLECLVGAGGLHLSLH